MNKFLRSIAAVSMLSFFLMLSQSAVAQKYRKIEDTIKLNKELMENNQSLSDLSGRLNVAESELVTLKQKAINAEGDAGNAAAESSDQASKATGGSVRDAKKAKRKADRAYSEARASSSAQGRVSSQERKINQLRTNIAKKQKRNEQLTTMRITLLTNAGMSIN